MTTVPAALRSTEYFWRAYRATWRGTVMTTFLNPVLYLAAMGVGLGSFIDRHGQRVALGGTSYLDFVAPALLAVTAMQTATTESTYPVMGAIKWRRTYQAMLATPLGIDDVIAGHVVWMALRVLTAVTVYLAVTAAFGVVASPLAVLAIPAGLLTGLAFALPLMGLSARQDNDQVFSVIFRLVVIPLFLFSGTFFPLSQLPVGLRAVAWATPLWHGVDLCRTLVLGTATPGRSAVHVAYLLALVVLGIPWARRSYTRRLRT